MQIKKVKPKMGFIYLAKHGLNKHGLKTQKLVSFGGRPNRRERERGEKKERRREKKREEEEEEEEEKKRRKRSQDQAKVWNYMEF